MAPPHELTNHHDKECVIYLCDGNRPKMTERRIHRWLLHLLVAVLIVAFATPQCDAAEFDYPVGGTRKNVGISTDVIAIGLPVGALTLILAKHDWNGLLRASIETAGVVGTSYLLKEVIHSERPDHSDDHSFPSLHASMSFLTASFLMRRYGWEFGVPAYALAAYVSWGRIYSKKHRFWDVAAGAALGTAVGLLFTTPFMEKHNVTIQPTILTTPSPDPHAAPQLQLTLTTKIVF